MSNTNNNQQELRLSPFMLWLPIAIALIALAWAIEHSLVDEALFADPSVQQPRSYYADGAYHVELQMNQRGHAIFQGFINNKPVTFLLDTGATHVAIPDDLAKKLGLRRGMPYQSHTANGITRSYATLLKQVQVGNIQLNNVDGAILPGMTGNNVLLGMSFLHHLEMKQVAGRVELIQRAAQ